MRPTTTSTACIVLAAVCVAAAQAPAQQVTVETPFHSASDAFFERMGVHWGFNWKGLSFSFGGPNFATPQFGGFSPSGLSGGWGFSGRDYNGFFNFAMDQGYRQSFVGQSPSVTLTNGYPGFISDTSVSPFVIGYVPIVGDFPTVPYPYAAAAYPGGPMGYGGVWGGMPAVGNDHVQAMRRQIAAGQRPPAMQPPAQPPDGAQDAAEDEHKGVAVAGQAAAQAGGRDPASGRLAAAQSSSAGRAVPSVAEARRLHQAEQASQDEEARALFQRGLTAEEAGKPGVARVYYRMAAKRATGRLKEQVLARIEAID
jgi:hypothetical protein